MSGVREGQCNEPGPYDTHCTDDPGHPWSCYDSGEDVSFNDRQNFDHNCSDPKCPTPVFSNDEFTGRVYPEQELVVDACPCSLRHGQPCVLVAGHGGLEHEDASGNRWGMHLPWSPETGYQAKPV